MLTRVRTKGLKEYTHVLEGLIQMRTEFYDPITLQTGEGMYIDSNMVHPYIAEGRDERCCWARAPARTSS